MALLLLPLTTLAAPSHSRHGKSRHTAKKLLSKSQIQAVKGKKAQLGGKLHGLHAHMHDVRAKIRTVKNQENHISESITTVEARIVHTRGNLTQVNARLTALAGRHDAVIQRSGETLARLERRRLMLGKRLRDTYQRGDTTYMQVLLQSRSVHDFLSRGYYVRRIVDADARLIEGVRQDIAQIEADKRILEAQAREQRDLATQYEAQKQQYAADLARKQTLLAQAHAQREQAESDLDDLEEESNAMTDRIRSLSEMLRRQREAERAAREEARLRRKRFQETLRRSRHGKQEIVREDPDLPEPPPAWHGGFIRPCPGPITSGFGYRFHPILHRRKLHTGVDFGAPFGAPIHAAGGGTVILAAYMRGYGNCMIVDHGDGVTTLYGHCSALLVSEGQTVAQGQVIARVGATGMATGPHLHFEVRHNGVPVAPF